MSTEDQAQVYRTFSYRVKDARAARRLRALGNAVNTVWNYCNEVSKRSAERGPNWITSRELQDLTRGSSRDLALSSQTVQAVCQEFVARRRAHGKPKLRWRRSRGAERSLGWVPFKNQTFELDGKVAVYAGQRFHLWLHRPIHGRIKWGSFCEDARGRWYCNITCEAERSQTTNRRSVIGIDLGFNTVAQAAVIKPQGVEPMALEQARFYRDVEARLAEAQRRGRKRQVKTLHAKAANRRKDALHKFSRAIVDTGGAVFVGNISPQWQIASGKGKATLDVSWSMLRNLVRYKCDHAGVAFAEVSESYTTQACSQCASLGGPKGREGLGVRQWVCGECGTVHDRDLNAAVNIARLGCETLGPKWPGSLAL